MMLAAWACWGCAAEPAVAAGGSHSLFLTSEGSLYAMGENDLGQLGIGSDERSVGQPQIVASEVQAMAAGSWHSLILMEDGGVLAAGDNGAGQFGDGTDVSSRLPVKVLSGQVQAVAAGSRHSLFLMRNGSAFAAGTNWNGELGDGTDVAHTSPVEVLSAGVRAVVAGDSHSLFLMENGSVLGSGNNWCWQLGGGRQGNVFVPFEVVAGDVQAIAAGGSHSLFLMANGSVLGTGCNSYGQLGNGNNIDQPSLVEIFASGVQAVAAGAFHSLFLMENSTVLAAGILCNNLDIRHLLPVEAFVGGVRAIDASAGQSLLLLANGSVLVAQLDDGSCIDTPAFSEVAVLMPSSSAMTRLSPRSCTVATNSMIAMAGTAREGDEWGLSLQNCSLVVTSGHIWTDGGAVGVVVLPQVGTYKLCLRRKLLGSFMAQDGVLLVVQAATGSDIIAGLQPANVLQGAVTSVTFWGAVKSGDRIGWATDSCSSSHPWWDIGNGTNVTRDVSLTDVGIYKLCFQAGGGSDSVEQVGVALVVADFTTCTSGTYLPAVGFQCLPCAAGRFALDPLQGPCVPCAAGNYSPSGAQVCMPCPGAQFALPASAQCQDCDVGSVPAPGQGGCLPCEAGKYTAVGFVCMRCTAGTVSTAGSVECSACTDGAVALPDQSSCSPCEPGRFALDHTVCSTCSMGKYADVGSTICRLDWMYFLWLGSAVIIPIVALYPLLWHARRAVRIVDVRQLGKEVVIKTLHPHGVRVFHGSSTPVRLTGTGHQALDAADGKFTVRVVDPTRLELLGCKGAALCTPINSSMGTLTQPFPWDVIHSGKNLPTALWSALVAALPWLVFLGLEVTGFYEYREDAAPLLRSLFVAGVLLGMLLAAAASVVSRWAYSMERTPMQQRVDQFLSQLSAPNSSPSQCERGPGRAISVGQLLDLLNFFQDFIGTRDAYYVNSNVTKPLTQRSRLSYAELVVPHTLMYFVSHFWGTPFQYLVEAVRKHAQAASPTLWEATAYWICFLSNNQWLASEELGGGRWQDSSFYLALQSSFCQGTCMVLDADAKPLSRTWCLFEVLQTYRLLENAAPNANFGGLFFCTDRGVLGTAHDLCYNVAVALARSLAMFKVQDSHASNAEDQCMIEDLIESDGGVGEVSAFICKNMMETLTGVHRQFSTEMQSLHARLRARHSTSKADITTGGLRLI